ncbi:MAG: Uma2 family endonuclease [Synechococcus sp.]
MSVALAKWSLDDYHQMVDSGLLDRRRVELLDGEILEMSPEGPLHSDLVDVVAAYLRQLLGSSVSIREGRPVTLPSNSEPEPDLAIVKPQRYREAHPGPDDIFWLIEVSRTTLNFDLTRKAESYVKAGIAEYWVIDEIQHQLWVHRQPNEDSYQSVVEMKAGTLTPLSFSEISVSMERLLG